MSRRLDEMVPTLNERTWHDVGVMMSSLLDEMMLLDEIML